MPPAATPITATAMMTTNSGNVTATVGVDGVEGIERHRHQMTVGDREDDEDHAQRDDDQRVDEFSHDHLSLDFEAAWRPCPATGTAPPVGYDALPANRSFAR